MDFEASIFFPSISILLEASTFASFKEILSVRLFNLISLATISVLFKLCSLSVLTSNLLLASNLASLAVSFVASIAILLLIEATVVLFKVLSSLSKLTAFFATIRLSSNRIFPTVSILILSVDSIFTLAASIVVAPIVTPSPFISPLSPFNSKRFKKALFKLAIIPSSFFSSFASILRLLFD